MSTTNRGLASIIMPCWNQVTFTEQCIAALKTHTRRPWELIVIDNGSTDHTPHYLKGVRDGAAFHVRVITNAGNRGFPVAINQGLKVARGEYLVLLNNDVVVTGGWLDQLVALANMTRQPADAAAPGAGLDAPLPPAEGVRCERNPESPIGLVGPMSNYATPPQLVDDVPYRDIPEMHRFARRWRDEHRGKWLAAHKLSGFCLLIKRAVYEKIGGLDERFGIGFFDDDDLAERARRAGFELAVARDLFIHHFGSRTFAGNGVNAERLLDENARRFAEKWGIAQPDVQRVALQPWSTLPAFLANSQREFAQGVDEPNGVDQNPQPPARTARVSLTMIVKNEEKNIARCLASVRGIFNEIVIVDTGSTDRTKEIARSFGAKVIDFPWADSFAAARNEALKHATGDYAFWLDADDVVDPGQRETLLSLLRSLRRDEPMGFVVRCACDPAPGSVGGETVVDHVRLFPVRSDARWKYRVHEQILPALNQARVPVRWTDLIVRHTGYSDPVLRGKKLDRDARLLEMDAAEHPNDPFVLFNLGQSAGERRQWREALGYLERSLAGSAPSDSIVRKLYALIAKAHESLGDSEAALRACADGLKLDPDDAELWFRKGILHRRRREPSEAERCWRLILTLKRPNRFCSVDQGIYGHLTRRNLAALVEERGDHAEAVQLWNEVLAECAGDRDALASLARLKRVPA